MGKWTRRAFIGTGTLVGGGFVLGVAGVVLSPSRHSVVSDDAVEKGELTTWITVTPDNLVTVLVPHCEMGQGSQTALAMMAAEEMEAEWGLVRVKEAPALGRGAQVLDAAVVGVGAARDQAVPLERPDEPRDRRHADLLGLGESRDGDGAGEDDHRQRRQARRAQARRRVRDADAAQQPDGTRVEPIGQLQGLTSSARHDIT